MFPLFMNRHVIKYILGRKIGWHDLAFFDPVMYESLRQLVLDSETKDASFMFTQLELTFCVELGPEEVGHFYCRNNFPTYLPEHALYYIYVRLLYNVYFTLFRVVNRWN